MQFASEKPWVIHIGNNDRIAARAQDKGFVCIGWTKMGDLTSFDSRDKMRAAYRRFYPDASEGTLRSSYGQPYLFAHKVKTGDLLVYPVKGSRDVCVGRVSSDYVWAGDDADLLKNDYCHLRRVEWLKRLPRIAFSPAALHSFGSLASISSSDEFFEEVVGLLKDDGSPTPQRLTSLVRKKPRRMTKTRALSRRI